MRASRSTVAAVSACALLAGCSVTVDGTATTSAGADPPVASRSLTEVLPTGEELSTTLSIGPDGFMGQLVEGGTDTLLRGVGDSEASPADCVSATYRLQNITYAASPVRSVASRSWTGGDLGGPAFSGFFGVVKLATAGDAEEFFATVAAKWRQCNGKTMVLDRPGRGSDGSSAINSVQIDGRVVSAVVTHAGGPKSVSIQRALGVAADCIVDVEVTDFGPDGGNGDADDAVDVANLMLDKIGR